MGGTEIDFISLRNDLLFHMVFTRNPEALKGLLSALLGISSTEILHVDVLNPMQYSELKDTKLTVLDLKLHLNHDRFILVEMQVRRFTFWTNRVLAYASRQIADQVQGDFNYGSLEPVIQISIMDHTLFPDHKRFFTTYTLRDETGYQYSDKLQLCVMDLTQIGQATEEQKQQGLVAWARAFRARSWNEVNVIEDAGVKEAAKTMQLILSNPSEREMIRARMDAEIDWRTNLIAAREEGIQRGIQEGLRKGFRKGREEGELNLLAHLVKTGKLSLRDAAAQKQMTEAEFAERVKAFL